MADRFSASLEFESGEKTEGRLLSHEIDETQENRVRYLPQSYFEKVCNEIGKVEAFRTEIGKVVFQYVPSQKRLGRASFKELIDYKKESIDKEIYHLVEEIYEINDKLIKLESQSSPEFNKSLQSKIKIKQSELEAHDRSKPIEVDNPAESRESAENLKQKEELLKWESVKAKVEEEIKSVELLVSNNSISIEDLQKSLRSLRGKYQEVNQLISTESYNLGKFGIDISQVISISFNETPVTNEIQKLSRENIVLVSKLKVEENFDEQNIDNANLATRLKYVVENILQIKSKFTGQQKHYQDYLVTLEEWRKLRDKIT